MKVEKLSDFLEKSRAFAREEHKHFRPLQHSLGGAKFISNIAYKSATIIYN